MYLLKMNCIYLYQCVRFEQKILSLLIKNLLDLN